MKLPEITAGSGTEKTEQGKSRFTVVIDSEYGFRRIVPADQVFGDTAIPGPAASSGKKTSAVPEKIHQMKRLYKYRDGSFRQKCMNFYEQGKFMEDYEDDMPYTENFRYYLPTYHDLNTAQLRGYFTWRKYARRGDWRPAPGPFAYIYIYELLCGIGAASPEETLAKMDDFESGFIDSGIGSRVMKSSLHRWKFEFAVTHDVSPETARGYADPDRLLTDRCLAVLKDPGEHSNAEIFSALSFLGKKDLHQSPLVKKEKERSIRLFAGTWRAAAGKFSYKGTGLFELCFGRPAKFVFFPLENAVYWHEETRQEAVYELDSCRRYLMRGGEWTVEHYDRLSFNRGKFDGLIHGTERILRKYLKAGSALKKKEEEAWAEPFVMEAIEEEKRAEAEAKRQSIRIDFSGLEKIREDAAVTRDSLLTEEELGGAGYEELLSERKILAEKPEERAETSENPAEKISGPAEEYENDQITKKTDQPPAENDGRELMMQILRVLLNGDSADGIIKEHHLIPSVTVDHINEALFDEIGDSVLECSGNDISIIEDYREDLEDITGGTQQ